MVIPMMFIVAGVIAVSRTRQDKHLNAVWRRWSQARSWQYLPVWESMVNAYAGGPFNKGGRRRADRGFMGTFDGLPVLGFRYRYTVSTGKSSSTYTHRICGVRFPGAHFPPLRILRESGVLFGRDLQFENVSFNEYWHVKSPSPRFAHDVLHARAMEYLMGPLPAFVEIWFSHDVMFVSVHGDPAPALVDTHLRMLTGFADQLRRHVLEEVGTAHRVVDGSGPGVSLAEQERRIMLLEQRERPPVQGR